MKDSLYGEHRRVRQLGTVGLAWGPTLVVPPVTPYRDEFAEVVPSGASWSALLLP